ncbi:MAG: DUF1109 domain-containing protein [Hyphomonadaceae bacterium]|nr:DUF1109 domain-containing protein [Hyphomonadaceae bacterium]
MKTENLIDLLARNVEPAQRPRFVQRLAAMLALGLAAALLLLLLAFGVRPDMATAPIPVMLKAMFSAAAAAVALPLAMRLMRPGRPLGWRVGALLVFVGVSALATIIALMGEMPERRLDAWLGGGFPWCLVLVPLLGAPAAALLMWLMRSFAPTKLASAGAAIGAVSGGVGAMAYSMYCPVDSIAFVTTWYVLAIAICAALGALVGSRLLRW